jgi:hypothetical protein
MGEIIHFLRRIPIAREYVTIPDEDNYSRPRRYAKTRFGRPPWTR